MKKIYIKDWLAYKPYKNEGTADIYYMNLTNKLIHTLSDIKSENILLNNLQEEELVDFSAFMISYFEDIISDLGIFKAFKNLNQELYGTNLPFFLEENFIDEINLEDVHFLTWYFFNLPKQDFLFNPKHEDFFAIAKAIYDVIDESYEFAPENPSLQQYYAIKDIENFDEVRYYFDKLLTKSYLFKYDTGADFHFKSLDLIKDQSQAGFLRYKSFRDYYVINQRTKLLGLRSCDWTAIMEKENEEISKALKNISENQQNVFRFIELDGIDLKVEHLQSGKEMILAGDNFDEAKKLPPNALFSAGVTKWKDKFVITGILWANQYDEKVAENYKNQFNKHHIFETEEEIEKRKEEAQWELQLFQERASHKDFNIANAKDSIAFINSFYDTVEAHHSIDKKQITDLVQQVNLQEKVTSILLYYNKKAGLEIYLNLPQELKVDHNEFYKNNDNDLLMKMMMSEEYSGEIFKAFKNNLNLDSELNAYSENDQNFLLRFFKPNYHQY